MDSSLLSFYPDAILPCPRCTPLPTLAKVRTRPNPSLRDCRVCGGTTRALFPENPPLNSHDEIVTGLAVGGLDHARTEATGEQPYDVIYDVAGAGPDPGPEIGWVIRDIPNGPLDEGSWSEFDDTATACFADWRAGKRVLLRGKTGLNRPALIAGLMLVTAGLPASDSIYRMRAIRSDFVLSNPDFLTALVHGRS